jgi:hypothetical protein
MWVALTLLRCQEHCIALYRVVLYCILGGYQLVVAEIQARFMDGHIHKDSIDVVLAWIHFMLILCLS